MHRMRVAALTARGVLRTPAVVALPFAPRNVRSPLASVVLHLDTGRHAMSTQARPQEGGNGSNEGEHVSRATKLGLCAQGDSHCRCVFAPSHRLAGSRAERNKALALYAFATVIAVAGLSYAAVPLYKMFCQATGYGGTTQKADAEKFIGMKPVEGGRQITVRFNADTSASMPWHFKPQQRSVKVRRKGKRVRARE
jgi:hypothetical protein